MKLTSKSPDPRRLPQTFESLHGSAAPPNCRPNTRVTTVTKRISVLRGSRLASFCLMGCLVVGRSGSAKANRVIETTTAQMAVEADCCDIVNLSVRETTKDQAELWNSRRLSQKQNRHVNLLEAMTPPTVGPMTDAVIYMLEIIDKNIGSFSFDTT